MNQTDTSTMGAAVGDDILIAPLNELAEFEACVELQIAVWGYSYGDLIPKRVFLVARQIGGQVIGALNGGTIIGFALSLPGYRDGRAYLHSHMLAVRQEYRNAGVGRRIKIAQRDDALARGIDLIEWTFDPLEIKNAHLNIARLGAIARRYHPDFYGPSSSPLQGGLPTDRLVAEWWLRSTRVRLAIDGIAETAVQRAGKEKMIPARSGEADPFPQPGGLEQVLVPRMVYDWKADPERRTLAESLQTRNRIAFESAFARGLAVTGYIRSVEGDGAFVLGPPAGLEDKSPIAYGDVERTKPNLQ